MQPQVIGQFLKFADRSIDLGSPIKTVLTAGHKHLALLDPFAGDARNVYCFDDNGREIWRIEAAPNVVGHMIHGTGRDTK